MGELHTHESDTGDTEKENHHLLLQKGLCELRNER